MNRMKALLWFSLLLCFNAATVGTYAQSRPLRLTVKRFDASKAQSARDEATKSARAASDARRKADAAKVTAAFANQNLSDAQTQLQTATNAVTEAVKQQGQAQAEVVGDPVAHAARVQAATQTVQTAQTSAVAANAAVIIAQTAQVEAAKAQAAAEAEAEDADAHDAEAQQIFNNLQKPADTAEETVCWLAPASHCYTGGDKIAGINSYYGMDQGYSFIDQVKSIYNSSSQTANISADLATLNFVPGIQVTFGTNAQVGVTTPTAVAAGATATLTPTSAAQATQDMLTGGTFTVTSIFPIVYLAAKNASTDKVLAEAGKVVFTTDVIAKGGVDLQNFKAGTSTTATNPPTHGNVGLESYLQINCTNLTSDSKSLAGDIFIGGNYGYNYASHGFARDYGFEKRTSSGVGQVVFGAVLNGIGRISVSRGFGPSQVYVDSTSASALPVRINNFKSWSFGLTYQK